MSNIILQSDSYKVSHWLQYPRGTEKVYSYFEARSESDYGIVFFGLQYIIKKYLTGVVVDHDRISEADLILSSHFGNPDIFNIVGWTHILLDHDGKLPLEIKAVSEGMVIPTKNVLFTVENTCSKCFWLTSYIEGLLEQVWYFCSVATRSYEMKQIIKDYLDKTGYDTPDFKLHNFGYRGSTSNESAAIADVAHLVNFKGSDTLLGILLAQRYYSAIMPSFSVPASEHSTITAWGRKHEVDAYENMLDKFPNGLVAVVSDSYNIFNACESIWGKYLKKKVEGRKGTLIIRPDSGNPALTVLRVLRLLGEAFGYSINDKGYKILPSYLRVIQGDGISKTSLSSVVALMEEKKWSIDNIAFGSGGKLVQNVNRDTYGFAYKTSNVTINGIDIPVSKDPITDPNKKSKEGRFMLVRNIEGEINTIEYNDLVSEDEDYLKPVFRDGELLIDQTLEEIRERTNQ